MDEYLYLFFIDLYNIYNKINFSTIDQQSPGYARAWIEAYLYAFQLTKQEVLTTQQITIIHSSAMSFGTPGGKQQTYSSYPSVYEVVPYTKGTDGLNVHYSLTENGIKEFVDFWMINRKEPIHTIVYEKRNQPDNKYMLKGTKWLEKNKDDFIEVANTSIHQDCKKPLFDPSYKILIHSLSEELGDEQWCFNTYKDIMDELVTKYNTNIKKATNDEDRIKIIVDLAQRIAQLHPFPNEPRDGTIRTCYILINLLLRVNNLPLTLLMNANRLYGCSQEELIAMVKQGQEIFSTVIKYNDSELLKISAPSETMALLKTLQYCAKSKLIGVEQYLIEAFKEGLKPNTDKRTTLSAPPSPDRFFAHSKSPHDKLLLALRNLNIQIDPGVSSHLNRFDYSRALRIACMKSSDALIITTILKFEDSLNINKYEVGPNNITAAQALANNKLINDSDKALLIVQLTPPADNSLQGVIKSICSLM